MLVLLVRLTSLLCLVRVGGAVTPVLGSRMARVPRTPRRLQARPAAGRVPSGELGRHPLPDRREGRPRWRLHGPVPLPGVRRV